MRRVVLITIAAALRLPASASAGEWLAGDLHVHTTYSHDSYGGPGDDNTDIDEVNTFGFPVSGDFLLAASRGLDYLAITDHNDIRSQSDLGFGASNLRFADVYLLRRGLRFLKSPARFVDLRLRQSNLRLRLTIIFLCGDDVRLRFAHA